MKLKSLIKKVSYYYGIGESILFIEKTKNSNFYEVKIGTPSNYHYKIINWLRELDRRNNLDAYKVKSFIIYPYSKDGSHAVLELFIYNLSILFVYPDANPYKYVIRVKHYNGGIESVIRRIRNIFREGFEKNSVYSIRYSLVEGREIIVEVYNGSPKNPTAIINAFFNSYLLQHAENIIEFSCDLYSSNPECYFTLLHKDGELVRYYSHVGIGERGTFYFKIWKEEIVYIKG